VLILLLPEATRSSAHPRRITNALARSVRPMPGSLAALHRNSGRGHRGMRLPGWLSWKESSKSSRTWRFPALIVPRGWPTSAVGGGPEPRRLRPADQPLTGGNAVAAMHASAEHARPPGEPRQADHASPAPSPNRRSPTSNSPAARRARTPLASRNRTAATARRLPAQALIEVLRLPSTAHAQENEQKRRTGG